MREFIVNPQESPNVRLQANNDPATAGKLTSTLDGATLRLVSHVKSLMQGASPETVAKLGEDRLKELEAFFVDENDRLNKLASQVKTAINSSLSIGDLKGLGIDKLRQLAATSGVNVNLMGNGSDDDWNSYDVNEFLR